MLGRIGLAGAIMILVSACGDGNSVVPGRGGSGAGTTTSGGANLGGSSSGRVGTSGGTLGTSGGSTSGGASSGGSTLGGGTSGGSSAGGSTGGGSTAGGAAGATSSGGSSAGSAGSGGAAAGGATSGGTGMDGSGSGGLPATCDPGTTATVWASSCPTSAPPCTAGTWTAGGPDPDHTGFRLIAESAHFAIYSDENVSTTTAQGALDTLENVVWKTYFGAPIYFKEPLCNQSNKIKASIHVHSDWGLTGGAWASNRMGMWIGTGALNDHWGLAHEFMHAVQSVSGGLSCGGNQNYCGWIYESHANFMPHQLPEYRGDVHCSELSVNAPHLYLGSTRDRYCNWQFMEFLKDKHCYSAVNEIWTSSPSNDPFTQIMKSRGWSISQMNDFFGEWAMHNVTWDYKDPPPTAGASQSATYRQRYGSITDKNRPERRTRLTQLDPLDANYATNRRFVTPSAWAPQRWGYNIVRLFPEASATSVTVMFRGVTQNGADSDWRWGLVATDSAITTPRYSALQRGANGQLSFCVKPGEALLLVVVGTPSVQKQINWDQMYNTIHRYPWMVQLVGAWPDGFRTGAQDACASGSRHSNGGGCVVGNVPASVFVGPYAQVLGGSVSGNARIEDHAVVTAGTVNSGTVGGLSVLMNGFTVTGSARVASTFYPLGFFEGGQTASGSAQLIGDIEYRGQGLNKSNGTFFGFVDSGTTAAGNTADVTVAGPYSWRP